MSILGINGLYPVSVIAGLDPAIDADFAIWQSGMDARVKPGMTAETF
jgi:hypothetical protein